MINPDLIDDVARKLRDEPQWQMSTACAPINTIEELNAPTIVKVVLDGADGALYFSRLPVPYKRDGEVDIASGLYQRHIGIYGYRGAFLKRFISEPQCVLEKTESLEQLRAMYIGGRIGVVRTTEKGIGVDRPEDIEVVERIIRGEA